MPSDKQKTTKDKPKSETKSAPQKAAKAPATKKVAKDKPQKEASPAKKAASAPKPAPKPPEKKAKPKKKAKSAPTRPPLVPKTYWPKDGSVTHEWRLIDATGQTLGRLGSRIATLLMGKNKPIFTKSTDTGDFVVVINAEKIRLTGKKLKEKIYYHHTGFPGGIKKTTPEELLTKHPERVIQKAVWGMLPKGHLGRKWISKLKVYAGSSHPHGAQNPQPEKRND